MSSSSHTNLTRHTHAPSPPGMYGKDKALVLKSAKKPMVAMRRTAGSESTVASKSNVSRGNVLKRISDTPHIRNTAEARYKPIPAGRNSNIVSAVTGMYTNVAPAKIHPDLESTYEKALSFSAFLSATKSLTRLTVAGGAGGLSRLVVFSSGNSASLVDAIPVDDAFLMLLEDTLSYGTAKVELDKSW